MLIDHYPPKHVFAQVPELANQADPVLVRPNRLLDEKWRKVYKAGDPPRLFTVGERRAV